MLGGDHAVAIGTLAGLAAAAGQPGGVIWIDAHGDLNTPETSPSGNVHGMPLAAALGRAPDWFAHERLVAAGRSTRRGSRSSGSARSTRPSGRSCARPTSGCSR